MATNTPSIKMQCQWIKEVLSDWAVNEGGVAEIVHDLNHLWTRAFIKSDVPRCLICFAGETIRGDFTIAAATSRVDRDFVVLVTRARGFTATRGDTLVEDYENQRPFYDLLEEARDLIRTLAFDPSVTEAMDTDPIDYKGIKPALPEDTPLDAYMIEFSIGTQLGVPVIPKPTPVIPSAPFNLTVSSGSAKLNWNVNSWDATNTSVYKSTDGINYTNYATLNGKTVLTYTDTNVSGGNQYWYKVSRFNSAGTSSFSNTASISF